MMPHMHVRGKDMTYTLDYPDGRKEIVLNVPHYDFNWQLGYETSIKVPKGTKLHVDAHFDNSANNKFNPNPNQTVYYGEMTWEEMMFPFFGVVVEQGRRSQEDHLHPRRRERRLNCGASLSLQRELQLPHLGDVARAARPAESRVISTLPRDAIAASSASALNSASGLL